MLELSPKWGSFFREQPETGMGYTICSVVTRDGHCFDRVVVAGGVVSSVDGKEEIPFAEDEIERFIVTHDKSGLRRS